MGAARRVSRTHVINAMDPDFSTMCALAYF